MHVLKDWYPVKPTAFILMTDPVKPTAFILMTELPGHQWRVKRKKC